MCLLCDAYTAVLYRSRLRRSHLSPVFSLPQILYDYPLTFAALISYSHGSYIEDKAAVLDFVFHSPAQYFDFYQRSEHT